jgi:hypothetical protein
MTADATTDDVPDSVVDAELYRRTQRLLAPGDVELVGCIVHTDLERSEDIEMMNASLEVGDVIAEHAGQDPGDVYVESGNDDPDFSSNQHQGLTIESEAFVWECQQLLREGTFDLVFYYEATTDHEGVLAELRSRGYTVQGVRPAGEDAADAQTVEDAADAGSDDGHESAGDDGSR